MANWFKEILMRFYLVDRPVAHRSKLDRRKGERRWSGPEGDKPNPAKDPRRRKERRTKKRR